MEILLLRAHGSFPFVANSALSGCCTFLGGWCGVDKPLESLSSDVGFSMSGEVPGQLPGVLVAIISLFQCELEAPVMPLPSMKSAIVSAGLDRHHERRNANRICIGSLRSRDHRGHQAISCDAAKVRNC